MTPRNLQRGRSFLSRSVLRLLLSCGAVWACQGGAGLETMPNVRVASGSTYSPQPQRLEAASSPPPSRHDDGAPSPEVEPNALDRTAPSSAAGVVEGGEPLALGVSDGRLPKATYQTYQSDGDAQRSTRFSELSPAQCRAELRKRKIAVGRAMKPTPSVATPVRIVGPLGKVRIVTPGPKSIYGVLDCRLLLVLAELQPVFAELAIDQVYVDNFYRPRARLPGRNSPSQHSYGLAVDIYGFRLTDGTVLKIEEDFHGVVGGAVCGADAAFSEQNRKSVLLRNIVCELSRRRAFNYLLTPNYDAAHRNHIHADIKRNCREHVVR